MPMDLENSEQLVEGKQRCTRPYTRAHTHARTHGESLIRGMGMKFPGIPSSLRQKLSVVVCESWSFSQECRELQGFPIKNSPHIKGIGARW